MFSRHLWTDPDGTERRGPLKYCRRGAGEAIQALLTEGRLKSSSVSCMGWAAILGLAACGAVYACLATWATWRFFRRPRSRRTARPRSRVLRPLHGDEPELYENLASLCAQDYAGAVRSMLGVADPADPALAVGRTAAARAPGPRHRAGRRSHTHGTNRKIGNLINMAAQAEGRGDGDQRQRRAPAAGRPGGIVAALEAPGVGLVYCLYRGRPDRQRLVELAAMDINTRFAPSVVVGEALGARPCLGPTMALRADVLAQIGGWSMLADVLADDFELGRAVRAAGQTIACPPMVIDHVFRSEARGEMLIHELRWARTVRLVEPAGYLGSMIIHFAAPGPDRRGLDRLRRLEPGPAGRALGFRLVQAVMLSRMMGRRRARCGWCRCAISCRSGCSSAAIVGDRVEWRGRRLRVGRDGAIAASMIDPRPQSPGRRPSPRPWSACSSPPR